MDKKDPREKWVTILPLIGLALGFCLAGFLIYDGLKTVVKHDYCMVLDDDFSGGIDPKVWTKEAEVGGFGYVVCIHDIVTDTNALIAMASSKRLLLTTQPFSSKTASSPSSQNYKTPQKFRPTP